MEYMLFAPIGGAIALVFTFLISGTMLLMDRTLTELGGQLESMKGSLDASIDKLKIAKTDMGDVYGY